MHSFNGVSWVAYSTCNLYGYFQNKLNTFSNEENEKKELYNKQKLKTKEVNEMCLYINKHVNLWIQSFERLYLQSISMKLGNKKNIEILSQDITMHVNLI